jgi:hypothetical protein
MGRVSAFIFFIAVIAVFDGLQTLMRHEFNSIDIVPGEELLISGMLPGGATSHEDLVVEMQGDDCLRFTPLETYKGFWMGGQMWRASLTAAMDCKPGKSVITVKDILPAEDKDKTVYAGKQNPALVFGITVFADEDTRREADNSLIRRYTGLPAFGIAAVAILAAILAGIGNWLYYGRSEKVLAASGVFFILGVHEERNTPKKRVPIQGYKATIARAGERFFRNEPVILLDDHWQRQGQGEVTEVTKIKAFAYFPLDGVRPRYGWFLAREQEPDDTADT